MQLGNADTLARQPISVAHPSRWASAACQSRTPQQRAGALAEYAVHLAGRPDLIELARNELAADLGCPCGPDLRCHRDILLDFAQPPADPYRPGGRALAVTLPRPWASLVLLPDALAPTVGRSGTVAEYPASCGFTLVREDCDGGWREVERYFRADARRPDVQG